MFEVTLNKSNIHTFSRIFGTGTQVITNAVELYGLAPTADGATWIRKKDKMIDIAKLLGNMY